LVHTEIRFFPGFCLDRFHCTNVVMIHLILHYFRKFLLILTLFCCPSSTSR